MLNPIHLYEVLTFICVQHNYKMECVNNIAENIHDIALSILL